MIWSFSLWVLLVLGLVVGVRAWLWDRAGFRGRAKRRCRKCWYDLTGAVECDDGYVCPECGKRHHSIRSMHKTRRSWRLVVVAVVLFLSAYAIGIRGRYNNQQFRRLGWPVLVPTPVLILTMPLMPDDAGSRPDRNQAGTSIPYLQRPLFERLSHQIKIRLYKSEETSWFDHWLFMQLARRESPQGLTDPSAVRGEMFRYVFNAWDRQGRLSQDEEDWARSVYQLEIRHRPYAVENMPAYAHFRVRRLLESGRWRIRIFHTLLEPDRRSKNWPQSRKFYPLKPVENTSGSRWDGAVPIWVMQYLNNGFAPPPTQLDYSFEGMLFEGDQYSDIWWPVAKVKEELTYGIAKITREGQLQETRAERNDWLIGERWIDSYTGLEVIDDPERYVDWLGLYVRANISRRDDSISLSLSPIDSVLNKLSIEPFTFGGQAVVMLDVLEGGRYDGPPKIKTIEVMRSSDNWWAVREAKDDQGRHRFVGSGTGISLNPSRSFENLPPRAFAHGRDNIASNDQVLGGYIEIRFDEPGRFAHRALEDLEMERFLTAPARFRLSRSDCNKVASQVRATTLRMGYIDYYSDEELKEFEEAQTERTWMTIERDSK